MNLDEARAILGPEVVERIEQAPPDPPLRPEQVALLTRLLTADTRPARQPGAA